MSTLNKPNTSRNAIYAAYVFANKAHEDQVRKYTNEPYINHCTEIVNILLENKIDNTPMIIGAYLHDVVEDTEYTLEDIREIFGDYITNIVKGLTDTTTLKDGNRIIRKQIERERLAKLDYEIQTIKIADLISNARSILQHDKKFAKVFMEEVKLLLEVLIKADNRLIIILKDIVDEWNKNG